MINLKALNSFVNCFLIKLYCLFLYGCCLWNIDSKHLSSLQIAINKVMHKVWHLPSQSHVSIVLSVSDMTFLHHIIYRRFMKYYKSGLATKSQFISHIFNKSSFLAYTFIGHDVMFGVR